MDMFGTGPRLNAPQGDPTRQAVAALRGYAYQLYASALAWVGLGDGEALFLEVAEDFAVVSRSALAGTQVKDDAASGNITLQSSNVRTAIDSFVDLVQRNPGRTVSLHYLTTAEIGVERRRSHRVDDGAALQYWRRAAAGANVAPLRALLLSSDLKAETKAHIAALSENAFRAEFLSRIHWSCGAPELQNVRTDLEAGLIEYVASSRHLSSSVGKAILPTIIERVLMTVVSTGPRQLRRADLLEAIDAVGMVSVPLEQLAAAFQGPSGNTLFSRPALLVLLSELPLPTVLAPRSALVASIDAIRLANGIAIANGATGLGKSLTARLVAAQSPDSWAIADFRNLSADDTASRLALVLGELVASPATNIILDDLNEIDDPAVRDCLVRLITGLRRRDKTAIITTYRSPTLATLHRLSPAASPVVEITYFREEEVAELVVITGGDAKYAGSVYHAASDGHPQLTIALLLRLSASKWSRASIASLLGGQIHVELGVERRAARQRLVSAAPVEAQLLLFRSSVIEGAFDRALAIALSGLAPAIPLPGVVLDGLVGPWIEPMGHDMLRVSPLLEGAAREVLSAADCRSIHHCVAETMMRRRKLSVLDAGMVLRHALGSEDRSLVGAFSQSVLSCSVEMIDTLAPFVGELKIFEADRLIFPKDPACSAMLRLAQLLVLLPGGTPMAAQRCWEALQRESRAINGGVLFESLSLSKLLMHHRTGEIFPNWIEFLLRFDYLAAREPTLASANESFQSGASGNPHVSGVLFASQMRNLRKVSEFRRLLERLDNETADLRERVFSSYRPGRGDISILVTHAWLNESRAGDFDWEAAAGEYATCAEIAMRWQNPMLASRCAVARSICYDENGNDPDRALRCLIDAEHRFGFDIFLVRARAKIHWKQRDHATALPLLTAAADDGGQDPLERTYIAREAGISAFELGDWWSAQEWFDRAHRAASILKSISVKAIAIGLLADTAHAAWCAGHQDIAIIKLRDALTALPILDPEGTLAEAYCHRVVRHAVLWLFKQATGRLSREDLDIQYAPGCASNPAPLEVIRSHPVIALDLAFYLVAEADEMLVEPTGFYRNFRDYLIEGPILSSEISMAIAQDYRAIGSHDVEGFVQRIGRHAAMAEMISAGAGREVDDQLRSPLRGSIPLATINSNASSEVIRGAEDFLLSFTMSAAIAGNFSAVDKVIEVGLNAPELVGLRPLVDRIMGRNTQLSTDREGAAIAINSLRQDVVARPIEFFWVGIWLLFHTRVSKLSTAIADPFIDWLFRGWAHLVSDGRFRLVAPTLNVPPIEAVLTQPDRTLAAAARLLLSAAPAVATSVSGTIHANLVDLTEGKV